MTESAAYQRRMRATRSAKGLCFRCGQRPVEKFRQCQPCRVENQVRYRRNAARSLCALNKACAECGVPGIRDTATLCRPCNCRRAGVIRLARRAQKEAA
jgi:hypothetical protein